MREEREGGGGGGGGREAGVEVELDNGSTVEHSCSWVGSSPASPSLPFPSLTFRYAYEKQNGVEVRVARIFNTFGPRMHPNDGRVVSNFIIQALQVRRAGMILRARLSGGEGWEGNGR